MFRITLPFPLREFQDISKKALRPGSSWSLCKVLFEGTKLSVLIRHHALETKFIQEMTEGSLSPTQNEGCMLQDIAYLANAGKLYSEAAQKMEEQDKPDFATFYVHLALKYETSSKESLDTRGPFLEKFSGLKCH